MLPINKQRNADTPISQSRLPAFFATGVSGKEEGGMKAGGKERFNQGRTITTKPSHTYECQLFQLIAGHPFKSLLLFAMLRGTCKFPWSGVCAAVRLHWQWLP